MKKTILLVLVLVLVLALGLATEVAKADFTFGTPTVIPYTITAPSVSTDGLSIYVDAPDGLGSGGWQIYVSTRETIHDDWPGGIVPYPPNSSSSDGNPDISADDLTLFFNSDRPEGYGGHDMWLTTRATTDDPWSEPVNLGPIVNGLYADLHPSISTDGLTLFFCSNRPEGYGEFDIYLSTRATINDPWSEPENLGPIVNSLSLDWGPDISSDGLKLFFTSNRPGGYDGDDIWVTSRATTDAPWGVPVNLGPIVNDSGDNQTPCISADGSILYFTTRSSNAWARQVSIDPVVDLNGDGIVDAIDMCIVVDHWGENYSLCDVGPTPIGDGIVDVQDLIVISEHLFEVYPSAETVDVNEADDGGQIELELGKLLVVTLESNPSTGYRWELVDDNESILKQFGEVEFKSSETSEPPIVGAGGWEIFRFKAVSAGQMTLELVYRRPWEDAEPLKIFSIQVVVP